MFPSFCVMFLSEYKITSFTNKIEVLLNNNLWNCLLNFACDEDAANLRSFGITGFE